MKVVRVYIKETGEEHYFTSLKGIYDTFSVEVIGCAVNNIWNSIRKNGNMFENSKVLIKVFPVRARKRNQQ